MKLDVLIFNAHPDDEVMIGGTIGVMTKRNYSVGIVDLTDGEPTSRGSHEQRRQEAQDAAQALKLKLRHTLEFKNRLLVDTLPSRIAVAKYVRMYQPKIVITMADDPIHPDHIALNQIVNQGLFYARLSKWDEDSDPELQKLEMFPAHMPDRVFFYPVRVRPDQVKVDFIIDTTDGWDLKVAAINCYESQFGSDEGRGQWINRVRCRDRSWGYHINSPYGEPYQRRRTLSIEDPVTAFQSVKYG